MSKLDIKWGTTYEAEVADGSTQSWDHHLSEAAAEIVQGHVEVYGTSFNATDTGAGYIKYLPLGNNSPTTYTHGSRGWRIERFDDEFYSLGGTTYDTYGSDSARTAAANFINSIMTNSGSYQNNYFVIVSYDAIGTNSSLATAMSNAGAWEFFNQGNTSNGPTHRHPYAAIGHSSLGILKESMHHNASGCDPAIVTMGIPKNTLDLGGEGYGEPLAADPKVYSGTGYPFKTYLGTTDLSTFNVKSGEYIRVTGALKCNDTALDASASVRVYLVYRTSSGSWGSSSSHNITSNEWEHFELIRQVDLVNYPKVSVHVYHMPSGNTTGLAYAKDITIQKCGFRPTMNNNGGAATIGSNFVHSSYIREAPTAISFQNPDQYYKIWASSKNLTGRPNLGDSRYGSGFDTNSVRWFDRVLTSRNEYSIHEGRNFSGDSNRYNDIGYINIDHTKLYVACIWMNNLQKDDTGGHNYFGCHTRNSSSSTTSTRRAYDSYSTTNPYFHYPQGANIEKEKWSCLMGWMVPSDWTDAQGSAFYNDVWSKFAGHYENGRADGTELTSSGQQSVTGGVSTNGGNIRLGRWNSTDTQFHIRWLDYYNTSTVNGGEHKTWWALPGIFQVDPVTFELFDPSGTGGSSDITGLNVGINITET